MITVAIGDIHGQYDMLDRLLKQIYAQSVRISEMRKMKLVFLGDYIDRGPQSRQVIRRLRELEGESAICLRGNHEQLMINCFRQPSGWQRFLANGGDQTLLSYIGHEDDFDQDRRWMSTLRTSYEDGLRVFVHAGINPKNTLVKQTNYSKMWIRSGFLNVDEPFEKYVIHGHTPTIRDQGGCLELPYIGENRCNIDTGAVYGGALTAAFFNDFDPKPFDVIGVT